MYVNYMRSVSLSVIFEANEEIETSIENAWVTMTDWSRAPLWMSSVESITVRGKTEVGAELMVRARGRETTSTIAECRQPTKLVLESVQGNVRARYTYSLAEVGDGKTSVTLVADCVTRGPVLALAGPLLRMMIKRADGGQVTALKAVIEAS